jgi:RNA polymerase sigma factor (sigma-70 family)
MKGDMIYLEQMTPENSSDTNLVLDCLRGNKEAFALIVAKHQSLICTIAYSATGNLTLSEDLAQETFITAWKQLRSLREPEKLRSWLCGIARRIISNAKRRGIREPIQNAELLENISEIPSGAPHPAEHAVSAEEQALLWRSLEQIPENYREPLMLFYRQNRSIAEVAQALELTEDAVKQRLSRGRKILHEQVLLFVEQTLERTGPGRIFTLSVVSALPLITVPASAATIGTTVVKSSPSTFSALSPALLGSIMGSLLGILGGYIGVKASLARCKSEKERQFVIKCTKQCVGLVLGLMIAIGALFLIPSEFFAHHPSFQPIYIAFFCTAYTLILIIFVFRANRVQRQIQLNDVAMQSPDPTKSSEFPSFKPFEYRSKTRLLGLPLIHIRFGRNPSDKLRVAMGWLAFGDVSIGIIASAGGLSLGGISVGGGAIGLVAIGGLATGGIALGGMAVGILALGGLAIGYLACGGAAIAWLAAYGGYAVANLYAVGGSAIAQYANDPIATAFVNNNFYISSAIKILQSFWLQVFCQLPLLLVLIPFFQASKYCSNKREHD